MADPALVPFPPGHGVGRHTQLRGQGGLRHPQLDPEPSKFTTGHNRHEYTIGILLFVNAVPVPICSDLLAAFERISQA